MSPVAPERKKRRLYPRTALERMQLAHRLREILYLGQDEILEGGSVPDERIGGRDAPDGGVQPREAAVGDLGGDLGPVAPGARVLVGDQDLVRLLDRPLDRLPVHRRQAAQVDDLGGDPTMLLEVLGGDERA